MAGTQEGQATWPIRGPHEGRAEQPDTAVQSTYCIALGLPVKNKLC